MKNHAWLYLLGALCAIGPLSIDMYLPGAPAMAREFGAGESGVQLSLVSYLLGLVLGQLVYGPLSDHLGRKPPLYAGLALFGARCLIAIHWGMQETLRANRAAGFSWSHVWRAYLGVLQDRQFVSYTVCNGLIQGGMYAYITDSSFVFIDRYGLTPQHYSLIFTANSLGMILAARINTLLIHQFALERIIARAIWLPAGLGLAAISIPTPPSLAVMLTGSFLFLASIGFIAPNAAALALINQAH